MAGQVSTIMTWSSVSFDLHYDDVSKQISSVVATNPMSIPVELTVTFQGNAVIDVILDPGDATFDVSAYHLSIGQIGYQLPPGWSFAILARGDRASG